MNAAQTLSLFRKKVSVLGAVFLIFALTDTWVCSAAFAEADAATDAGRIFELHAKLPPGMTLDAMNDLLGPPAEKHSLGDNTSDVMRYMWLHGEMGIEAYFTQEAAYRISITLPCQDDKNTLRVMDALTRQGNSKYGSMPQFDHTRGEYYWARDSIRFAFSKYNSTTVLSSSTQMR